EGLDRVVLERGDPAALLQPEPQQASAEAAGSPVDVGEAHAPVRVLEGDPVTEPRDGVLEEDVQVHRAPCASRMWMQLDHMPMFEVRPMRAPSTCREPASPRSCVTISLTCPRPVAPSGWPLAMRPPLGFTGIRPPARVSASPTMRPLSA